MYPTHDGEYLQTDDHRVEVNKKAIFDQTSAQSDKSERLSSQSQQLLANYFDEIIKIDIKGKPKPPPLSLHEKCILALEAKISEAKSNNFDESQTRDVLWSVAKLALDVLKYDPTPMIKADAKRRIKEAFDSGMFDEGAGREFKTKRGRWGGGDDPIKYILEQIKPLLLPEQMFLIADEKAIKENINLFSFLSMWGGGEKRKNHPLYRALTG